MKKELKKLTLWVVALCAVCVPAFAQRITGSIVGIVTDSTGAVIANAKITVVNVQTGVARNEVANETGNYRVVSLPPGDYNVTAFASGFSKEIQQGVTLEVDQDLRVNFSLKAGSVDNAVTVTTDVPLLNTENGERGTTLTEQQVNDLPSLDRDVLASLPLLSPGTVLARSSYDNDPPIRFSVNGGRALTQDLVVDGAEAISVNINSWNMGNVPDQDVVSELKFQTNAYAAENGRGTATINIITKSGTNKFHGGVYDYFNNSALNANDFFTKLNQLNSGKPNKVTSSHANLYGGTLGGPILKDKAFFFMLYERQPNSTSTFETSTVPTTAFKSGDFSALCQTGFAADGVCNIPASANSNQLAVTIYDPATTTANPAYDPNAPLSVTNTPYLRSPFPGNVIPTARLSTVATNVLSYLPTPTNDGLQNNEQTVTRGTSVIWRINPRVDYNFSDRHLAFYKLGHVSNKAESGGIWPGNNPADNSHGTTSIPNWESTFGDTYTINPRLVSDFRVGFERDSTTSTFPGTGQNYAGKIGLPNSNAEQFPVFSFAAGPAGYGGIGPSNSLNQWEQTLAYNEALSYLRGKHAFKFGGEIRFNEVNKQGGRSDPSGAFGFSGAYTAPYVQNPNQTLNASMADFLLGDVSHYSIDPAVFVWGARKKEGSYFVQDDWKITPKLTLNLGIRQDIQMSWHEVQNRYTEFSPTVLNTFNPTYAPTTTLTLPGGLVYGVTQTNGNKIWNFAPRLGFAYTPFSDAKTVLRGGFGVFISPASTIEDYGDTGQGQETGYSPHAATSTTSQLVPAFLLSAGGPTATLPAHTPEAANNGGAALYIDHGESIPKVYVWSGTVARELPYHVAVEASYVGTRGSHLPFERELNQVNAAGTAAMETLGVQNPAAYLPYPQNIGLSGRYHDGNSLYNSMQLKVEEKIGKNLDWTIAYTLARSMDNSSLDPTLSWGGAAFNGSGVQNIYDLRSNYARSSFDQRQAFSASFIYQLPFGHGQKFLNQGPVGRIVGGWQVNSIVVGRDGTPAEFSTSDVSYTDNAIGRPNCTAGQPFREHATFKPSAGGFVGWWNPAAFSVPAPYAFGNCGRNLSSVPGYQDVDLSLLKNTSFPTPLNENTEFQFRAEAFNAMNRTNLGTPNNFALASNSSFGFINSDVNGPRTMTISLRIIF